MRILSLVLCFIVIGFFSTAQQYSLKQCIDTALNRNILVQQTGLQMQSAEVDKNQAKMNLLPNVNSRWNYGNNFGRNVDPITNT
ncbi:MAG TPA: TolC family protein, partial [Lacibacter sp.]|nr:TolC family protein [Lacibacter sp.]